MKSAIANNYKIMTISAGKVIGKRYQILSDLGSGGFGKTFLAVDLYLPNNNRCVVKQLQPDSKDPFTLETARRLFQKEAEILQQLGSNPQIPQLFAYFEEDCQFYLVQEYIEGHELASELTYHDRQQIIRQQYNEQQTIALLQEILSILQFIHQYNVIHRDLNPHNLIRRHSDKKLVIIDFGAVKQITSQTIVNHQTGNQKRMTVSIGTPGYLPSEQANGNPRFSSDIYAVGIIGIRVLTGCLVEELKIDPKTGELDWHNLNNKINISSHLKNFFDTSVRYDYRQRYPSAVEALQVIQKIQGKPDNNLTIFNRTVAFVSNSLVKNTFNNRLKQFFIIAILIAVSFGGYTIFDRLKQQYTAKKLYLQANTLYDLKRYQEAYTFYEKVLKTQPNNSDALLGKADALQKLNRDQDALINYEKAIQIDSKKWQAWLGRARSQLKLGKEIEAKESLTKIVNNEPSNYLAWGELAQLYLKKEQYAEAIDPLNRVIRANQNDPTLRYQQGWAFYRLKQYKNAKEAYEDAINLKPDYNQAWYQKGNALIQLKKQEEALEAYNKAIEFNPEYTSAWYAKATTLKTLERYSEALQAYEKTVTIRSSFWQAWYDRGWTFHQLKQYNEAIIAFDRALKINPSNYLIWYNRGNSAYNSSNYKLAITSYQKTVYLQKNFFPAWLSLGNSLLNDRQYKEAITAFDRVLQDNPNNEQAQQGKTQAEKLSQTISPQETEVVE